MPTAATELHPRFRPELEGLRAVAVIAVVLYHARVPGFSGGYVGVDVFFVLSGYLISELLLVEIAARGAVDLTDFYSRRVRRLVPAGLVLLASVIAFAALYGQRAAFPDLPASATAAAIYASNLHFITAAFAYFDAGVEHNPLVHTWSLGVEAQFYLLWPLVLGLAAKRRSWLIAVIAVLLVASFAASVVLVRTDLPLAFYGLPTRLWELATGGLLALASDRDLPARLRNVLSLAGVIAIGLAVTLYDRQTLFPGWTALLPTLGAAAVIAGSGGGATLGRALAWRPLQVLGGLSYSWYLWHWPLLAYLALALGDRAGLWRPVVALAALVPAAISFRFVEQPVRRSAFLRQRPVLTLALGAAATALVVGLASTLALRT